MQQTTCNTDNYHLRSQWPL